jgi:integrase
MHVAELQRFATSGAVEALPAGRRDHARSALVLASTKAGDPLRIPVSPKVAEAARRVLAAGSFDVQKLDKALRAACREAGIEPFGPGRLRHSVATLAINRGADPATVAAFLNHKSPRTTRRFYAQYATPAKIPTLL